MVVRSKKWQDSVYVLFSFKVGSMSDNVRGYENTQPYVVILIPDSPSSKNMCMKQPRLESDLG